MEKATHAKQSTAWDRWQQYCNSLKLTDPYINKVPQEGRVRILCSFMHAVRTGRYAKDKRRADPITAGYTCATVDDVAATMRARGHRDPRVDSTGAVHIAILRQTRAYKKNDPNIRHQRALPIRVYEQVHAQGVTPFDTAVAYLLSGALFFAMRSCEYTMTKNFSHQRTKTITVGNVRFYKNKREMRTGSPSSTQQMCSLSCLKTKRTVSVLTR